MASRRTGLWLLTTLFIFFLGFTLFVWVLNRLLVGSVPTLGGGTILTVRLQGTLGEVAQTGPFLGPLTVREIDEALDRAAADDRVAGVFLDVGPLAGGYGKTQEVRAALHRFRDSGKPVVALLEVGSGLDLYLAAAAETVYQVPTGQLVLGMLVEEPFYRELLDKLGVRFQVFASGPYKAAFNALTERELGDAQREMSESLLDSLYGQWIEDVADDRGMPPEELQGAFDEGLLSASRALELGLVDELGYRDQVDGQLAEIAGRSPRRLNVREYLRATAPAGVSSLFSRDNVIAVVHVSGLMIPGDVEAGLFGADIAAGNTIAGYLRDAREDPSIEAIVLRVDSGGGAVSAADVIGREPVVVSMSDVAASGGYWIASKATRVFANRATYTGSIGVVMGRLSLQETYDLLGISHGLIKRGENADLLTTTRDLRPEQAALLERSVAQTYADFLDVVARGREMTIEQVDAVGQGRVWTGLQALEHGLIDNIGGLREALAAARAEAGIGPSAQTAIRIYPQPRTLFEELSRLFTSAAAVRAPARGWSYLLPRPASRSWDTLQTLRATGSVWTLMDASLPGNAGR